jgi:superfamily II DNA helicase RecQ
MDALSRTELRQAALCALQTQFGLESFRAQQADIVSAVLEGYDVFVRMATGGGKSLCFQLPAVVHEGTTVVVCPLIALMEDQVASLQKLNIAALVYNGEMKEHVRKRACAAVLSGQVKIVYTTPEQLEYGNMALGRALQSIHAKNRLQRFVLDEAHVVGEWGNTFRCARFLWITHDHDDSFRRVY